MLFASWQFALFFPLVTAGYFLLPGRMRWAWLLLASCAFYMAFVPSYILILALTIAIDYVAGRLIEQAEGPRRALYLVASLLANLGVLAFFKYFNFANANFAAIASFLHWHYPIQALSILLPIGLSFHVFQSLSYTIEVYRGNQPAEKHLGIFALYVMFYPQLVAGPIERPQNLLHQFREVHAFDAARVSAGLRRMAWGLAKKVLIADRLAAITGPVFAAPHAATGLTLALAVVGFSYQIYCDFSGYSDIAVGAARVMGFRLMENFHRPYAARSVRAFWSRWHISLSTWFRDYLYIPLGGNRVGRSRHLLNLVAVFVLSGLWHGAAWTFVIWGGLHAAYSVFESLGAGKLLARPLSRWPRLQTAGATLLTFTLVTFAWIFFRATSLSDALYIASHVFTGWGAQLSSPAAVAGAVEALGASRAELTLAVLGVVVLETSQWLHARGLLVPWFLARPRWVRWAAYQAAFWVFVVFGAFENREFIYFQF